jgi:hypothetical protein
VIDAFLSKLNACAQGEQTFTLDSVDPPRYNFTNKKMYADLQLVCHELSGILGLVLDIIASYPLQTVELVALRCLLDIHPLKLGNMEQIVILCCRHALTTRNDVETVI